MNTGAKIVWTLRQLNEGLKQEGFPLMDDIIEQVQSLVEQTGHLGDRIHEYTDRIAHLEYQITEAHQQNETLQSEMRLAREERDEVIILAID
jgi:predicted RNase H-like nuclease (RuvC/YqgF family)